MDWCSIEVDDVACRVNRVWIVTCPVGTDRGKTFVIVFVVYIGIVWFRTCPQ